MLVSDGAMQYIQDLAAPLSQVLATTDGVTTTDYLYGVERLVAVRGGTRTWYGSDALGSVRQTLNDAGTLLSSISYDPWGTVESGSVPAFGFTGEVQDAAAGLVYLRARWYNPAQATFTAFRWRTDESDDTVPYSHHPYVYALSNPVLFSDPTGKCTSWVIDAISNAFGGPVRGDCQYQGWANIPNNLQEGIEYNLGLAGVERDANGNYDIVDFAIDKNPIFGPAKQITHFAQYAATLAVDPAARAAAWDQVRYSVNPHNWPGMLWRGITQPFKDFSTGFTCDDNYLLGRGTRGIGEEVVGAAGLVDGGLFLRNWLRARTTTRLPIDVAVDMKRGLGTLAGRQFRVSAQDLATIERHLGRFDQVRENIAMIARLRSALADGRMISGADASFYFHELTEARLMDLGIPYDVAHQWALNKYGVSRFSVYHPDVIQSMPEEFHPNFWRFWRIER